MFINKHKSLKYILFIYVLFGHQHLVANTDSLTTVINDLIELRDSLLLQERQLEKIDRKKKVEETFKFLSYFNYSDRGNGVQYKGIDKYTDFKDLEIDHIYFKILEPFGCDDCSKLRAGQKFGNKIHFNTREWQAKQDVLFKEGDKVNPSIFADTEKLLWERNRYKYVDISLTTACNDYDSILQNKVDVYVFLVDKLSYTFNTGYSEESIVFAGTISNFFKLPNTLTFRVNANFNKLNPYRLSLIYNYYNLFNSKINFNTSFIFDKMDRIYKIGVQKDFISINTKWAFDVNYAYSDTTISLTNNLRDEHSLLSSKSNRYNLWAAYAFSFKKLKDQTLKLILSTKIRHLSYFERPFITNLNYNSEFINNTEALIGIGLAHWNYTILKNAFYIDIPEYLPKKWSLGMWFGLNHDELIGARSKLNLSANYGNEIKKFGYVYSSFSYTTFINNLKGEQMLFSLAQSYITPSIKISKHVFFRNLIHGKFNYGIFYPEYRYFNINNTIRGFYSSNLKGSKSITVSFESNLLLDKKIAMSKGMAYFFADLGWISANGQTIIKQSDFQYGIGFGLRIRSVDLGLPFLDLQFAFYPKGKTYNVNNFSFRLYENNFNAITTDNLFFENPRLPNTIQ